MSGGLNKLFRNNPANFLNSWVFYVDPSLEQSTVSGPRELTLVQLNATNAGNRGVCVLTRYGSSVGAMKSKYSHGLNAVYVRAETFKSGAEAVDLTNADFVFTERLTGCAFGIADNDRAYHLQPPASVFGGGGENAEEDRVMREQIATKIGNDAKLVTSLAYEEADFCIAFGWRSGGLWSLGYFGLDATSNMTGWLTNISVTVDPVAI